jgi:hypothetical protein
VRLRRFVLRVLIKHCCGLQKSRCEFQLKWYTCGTVSDAEGKIPKRWWSLWKGSCLRNSSLLTLVQLRLMLVVSSLLLEKGSDRDRQSALRTLSVESVPVVDSLVGLKVS